MTHVIGVPAPDDAPALGSLQLTVWLETYPNAEAGIDEAWIREHRGSCATTEGIARWRDFIEAAGQRPDLLFCRVVRSGTEIVGFLCGRREEVVTLGPMYLLERVRGRGAGDLLMGEFLAWAEDEPVFLWVTEYNDRAVRFYERYGFEATGERELWRGRLPNARMARSGAPSAGLDRTPGHGGSSAT
ncbi:GNAT family N-acetyltransferase [Streptomyces sp. NPDC091416]|uniref:GNAT family N-acetyltransferase n=1 Tax=Streptomyces sp. NPDC091416 TaxID=3366003 RepID=UPI00380F1BE7